MAPRAIFGLMSTCILTAVGILLLAHTGHSSERDPASYIELSGSMRAMESIFAGKITGSLYNSHPTKAVRVMEITVSSSSGRRVFRVDYVVPPQEILNVSLETGLHLNFRDGERKDWWSWRVTRATWHSGVNVPSRGTE